MRSIRQISDKTADSRILILSRAIIPPHTLLIRKVQDCGIGPVRIEFPVQGVFRRLAYCNGATLKMTWNGIQ